MQKYKQQGVLHEKKYVDRKANTVAVEKNRKALGFKSRQKRKIQ